MGFNVAYVPRNKIKSSIAQNVIPKETLIITTDENTETFYYDDKGKIKNISIRMSFSSYTEARTWIAQNDYYIGKVITVLNNGKWIPYLVEKNQTLSELPMKAEVITTNDTVILDGGSAPTE